MRAFFLALILSFAIAGGGAWWLMRLPEVQPVFEPGSSLYWLTLGFSVYNFGALIFLPMFIVFWLIGWSISRVGRA
ncbi:MAG: hypothetical protein ABL866_15160 [Devosia sp.]